MFSDDLSDLEQALAQRPVLAPPDSFRGRVLAAMGRETRRGQRRRWLAAGVAAVVLWINFSMSAAQLTPWQLTSSPLPQDAAAFTDRMRAAAPDLPPREARRQALIAAARAHLAPAPTMPYASQPTKLEDKPWVMH